MKRMMHLCNVNVASIMLELKNNPQLWNMHNFRTQAESSPHHGLDDIWVRYQKEDGAVAAPHESIWYPESEFLPSVKALAYEIMHMVKGERLGGILITRIPPGKMCKPHTDSGSWHAEYYDKYAVQIESNCLQAFHFEGESFCAKPGDVYWFDNQYEHWVTNESNEDRITLIICIRTNKSDKFSK
jgi:hypothetical protein